MRLTHTLACVPTSCAECVFGAIQKGLSHKGVNWANYVEFKLAQAHHPEGDVVLWSVPNLLSPGSLGNTKNCRIGCPKMRTTLLGVRVPPVSYTGFVL